MREVQRSIARSVKQTIADKIAKFGAGAYFDQKKDWITTPGNGIIIFAGMQHYNSDSIKSLEGFDGVWVEEAQTLSQVSLDMLRPTLRSTERHAGMGRPAPELWFSWNPRLATDPVDALFRQPGVEVPNAIIREVNWRDNPWFPDDSRAEMEWDRARDPDKYAHIWLGHYQKNSQARVFANWRIDKMDIPRGGDVFPLFGADWGATVDPTVLIRCWIIGRTLYVDREAYKVGCPIDQKPALFQTIQDGLTKDIKQWPITADSAWPDTITFFKNANFKIKGARKGPGSVEEGVEFLKNYDIVVHPDCRHAIDELTLYSYKVDKLTGLVLPVLDDKNNHVIDALRYAVESTRKPPVPVAQSGTYRVGR